MEGELMMSANEQENEKRETIADIVADIRERAYNATRHGERTTDNYAVSELLKSIAARIEAAWKREREVIDYSAIHAVCRECATAAGFVPKDKAVGVWICECEICHKRKPCTDLHHDWRRKKEGGAK